MLDNAPVETKSSIKNQLFAVVVINIITFNQGCAIGWVSPSLPTLLSDESPLGAPLTPQQTSFIASAFCLGAICGTTIWGWLSDKLGRKRAGLVTAVPFLFCWSLKLLVHNPYVLIFCRFLAGVGGSGMLLVAPIYSAEVSSAEYRGALGSLLTLTFNVGIVFVYILGAYLSYTNVLVIMLTIPIIFLLLMVRMPESPTHLARIGKYKEASEAIAWFRNIPVDSSVVRKEVENLKYEMQLASGGSQDDEKSPGKNARPSAVKFLLNSPPSLRTLGVTSSLLFAQCFMGLFAVLSYASAIFKEAGSTLSPSASSIIVGTLQLLGSLVASSLIERLGRKVLLISSSICVIFCMGSLGTYFFFRDSGYDMSSYGWIPVFSLSTAVCTFAMGIGPIPFILPSEMFMVQVRGLAASLGLISMWICTFILAQFFGPAVALFGNHIVFWGFGFVGCIAIFICVAFLPETKGVPLDEIVRFFGGKTDVTLQNSADEENGKLLLKNVEMDDKTKISNVN